MYICIYVLWATIHKDWDARHAIPYHQKDVATFKQQLGLYVFDRDMLELFPELKVGENEKSESVEMLRYMENGHDVKMIQVDDDGLSVDTIEDLKRVEEFINAYNWWKKSIWRV